MFSAPGKYRAGAEVVLGHLQAAPCLACSACALSTREDVSSATRALARWASPVHLYAPGCGHGEPRERSGKELWFLSLWNHSHQGPVCRELAGQSGLP